MAAFLVRGSGFFPGKSLGRREGKGGQLGEAAAAELSCSSIEHPQTAQQQQQRLFAMEMVRRRGMRLSTHWYDKGGKSREECERINMKGEMRS